MSTIKTAVICAAGMGTRLGMNMPKCLVEVNQKKIIEYQLDLLKEIETIIIVIGFMEEKVVEVVKAIREDVIFVRNPKYKETTNAYSLYLGSHFLSNPFLMLDGDLIIEKNSFKTFLSSYTPDKCLIGVVEASTEEAVFTEVDKKSKEVIGFSRKPVSNYEWSGLAIFNSEIHINKDGGFVFSELEKHLPLPYEPIQAIEIDTPNDFDLAKQKIVAWHS